MRLMRRDDFGLLWANDLAGSGARLAVDLATAAGALWNWISGRRLMTNLARTALIAEIKQEDSPGFPLIEEGGLRR